MLTCATRLRMLPLLAATPNAVGWVQLSTTGDVFASTSHALAFDNGRNVLVKFGGADDLGLTVDCAAAE